MKSYPERPVWALLMRLQWKYIQLLQCHWWQYFRKLKLIYDIRELKKEIQYKKPDSLLCPK